MAREDWGIAELHHRDVPCLASILSVNTAALPEDAATLDELRVHSPPGSGGKDAGSSSSPRDGQSKAARSWSAELALGDLFGSGCSVASSRVKLASLVAGTTASSSRARRSASGTGSGSQQGHGVGSTSEATEARLAAAGSSAALTSPAASDKPSPWRMIYRDRAQVIDKGSCIGLRASTTRAHPYAMSHHGSVLKLIVMTNNVNNCNRHEAMFDLCACSGVAHGALSAAVATGPWKPPECVGLHASPAAAPGEGRWASGSALACTQPIVAYGGKEQAGVLMTDAA